MVSSWSRLGLVSEDEGLGLGLVSDILPKVSVSGPKVSVSVSAWRVSGASLA